MLKRAERILVDSDFTRREVLRLRPEAAGRLRVVPLGVDMDRQPAMHAQEARAQLGWPTGGPPQLITVGRLEWQKGHDLAIDALARLQALEWTYWIVGEGSARASIERRIRRHGLSGRIHVTGRVEAAAKSRMLAAADLFLWPERTHPAFGLVGLEAMLMNTPVLGARRGAIPELIDAGSGWTHEPESAQALAAALEPLLREPERLARVAAGLRERALRRFEPDAMARGTLEVYRELASK
jgi:glycogen(starch) synthase